MTTHLRRFAIGLTSSLFCFFSMAAIPAMNAAHAADEAPVKDAVRMEVGKPLKAAQELSAAKKFQEAMAKVDEADAIPEKTPYESYVISRTRGTTALGLGNLDLAAKSFTTAMTFNKLTPDELLDIARVMAGQFYGKQDYVNSATWATLYLDKGGKDEQLKILLAQSYYLRNDFPKASGILQEIAGADEAAGRVTKESLLLLLFSSQYKQKNTAGMVATMEKLTTIYPKKDYWNDLIRTTQRLPDFSERLALDAYRLQILAGSLSASEEYMEMAALAMQAGFPTEAKQILDKGYAEKLLGTGPDEAKHKNLQALVLKGVAEEQKSQAQDEKRAATAKVGTTPVNSGFNLVLNGQYDKGIALIEKGIALGGLKFPEDAKLKLAMSYVYAGQKDKAEAAFKGITGKDGSATLAKLWLLWLNQSQKAPAAAPAAAAAPATAPK